MELGSAFWIVALLGLLVIVAVLVGRNVLRGRRSSVPEPALSPSLSHAASNRLSARLAALHAAGRSDELVRMLDQTLPEWVVAGSLVETVRELAQLDAAIAHAQELGVTDEVTGRLREQSARVATDLWALAERILVAEQSGSRESRAELERQDASLLLLTDGMQEARDELSRLSLPGGTGEDLERADRRFRSLAATARELHEWERERLP